MHVVAFASGEMPGESLERVRAIAEGADIVVAVDGGIRHCARVAVTADVLVGDLDSAPPELVAEAERGDTEVLRHPVEKDETDLELALELAVNRGARSVTVVGLFGGRVDHELANIGLLASARWVEAGCVMGADDGNRSLWVVHDRLELQLEIGTTVSLLPWGGDALGVASTGVQWPLDGVVLPAGTPRGISNVTTEPTQTVAVASGVLLVLVDRSES